MKTLGDERDLSAGDSRLTPALRALDPGQRLRPATALPALRRRLIRDQSTGSERIAVEKWAAFGETVSPPGTLMSRLCLAPARELMGGHGEDLYRRRTLHLWKRLRTRSQC